MLSSGSAWKRISHCRPDSLPIPGPVHLANGNIVDGEERGPPVKGGGGGGGKHEIQREGPTA